MLEYLARMRERKLAQWALAYAAAAWIALQVIGLAADGYGWSPMVVRLAFGIAIIGFLVTLVLAWYHGERGQQRVSTVEVLLLAVLLTVGGGLIWQAERTRQAPGVDQQPAPAVAAVARENETAASRRSIAVMPFKDLSRGPDDALFADGLSEEIINSLARVPDLQVAARSSSFGLRDNAQGIPAIAAKLGVATVLEGSVRRVGERLRITAQLIRAADGFSLWSETYDRTSADIIEIQEDVARSIAQALQTVTDPQALAAMQKVGTRSVPAYDAYLKGVAMRSRAVDTGDYELLSKDLAFVDAAIALDPGFEEAHAVGIAIAKNDLDPSVLNSEKTLRIPYPTRVAAFRQRLQAADEQVTDPALRNHYQSMRALVELRFRDALRLTQAYLRARPTDYDALEQTGTLARYLHDPALVRQVAERLHANRNDSRSVTASVLFMAMVPDHPRAVAMARAALQRFPDSTELAYQAQRTLLSAGRAAEAAALVPRLEASEMHPWSKRLVRMRQACAEGRRGDAERELAGFEVDLPDFSARWHALLLLGREDEAAQWLAKYDQPGTLPVLAGFLVYPKFDVARFPRLRAALEAQGIATVAAQAEPYNCPASATP